MGSIDTIIVCGGKGSRIGKLADKHGCKSLVPILGIPTINYLTYVIRKAVPNSRIILAIDNPQLKPKFEETYEKYGVKNYQIYEGLTRGPVQAFYEAGGMCRSDKVLIFFGNQLVSFNHIKRLLSHDDKTLIFSAFNLLSENNCKIATIDKNSRVLDVTRYNHLELLKESEVYLDVPYVVPNNFFSMETFPEIKRLFVKTPMDKTCLARENMVLVEKSDFPPEFHFRSEIKDLEKYVREYSTKLLSRFRGKTNG
jgi:NDP-sugar pyrophosphorylase family protein